jgi:hypothetical protein
MTVDTMTGLTFWHFSQFDILQIEGQHIESRQNDSRQKFCQRDGNWHQHIAPFWRHLNQCQVFPHHLEWSLPDNFNAEALKVAVAETHKLFGNNGDIMYRFYNIILLSCGKYFVFINFALTWPGAYPTKHNFSLITQIFSQMWVFLEITKKQSYQICRNICKTCLVYSTCIVQNNLP